MNQLLKRSTTIFDAGCEESGFVRQKGVFERPGLL
jgi:hypothetical protein